MKTYTTLTYKSASEKKVNEEKMNENRNAKYHVYLTDGVKTAIPLETQLRRFKSTLKK